MSNSRTKPTPKAKANATPEATPTEALTFEMLCKRHGDIEAMQILEALEATALCERQKKIILATPAQRFTDALAFLTAKDEPRAAA